MKILITEKQKLLLEQNKLIDHAKSRGLNVYRQKNKRFYEVTDESKLNGHDILYFLEPTFVKEFNETTDMLDQYLKQQIRKFGQYTYARIKSKFYNTPYEGLD